MSVKEKPLDIQVKEKREAYDKLYDESIAHRDEMVAFTKESKLEGEERSNEWQRLEQKSKEFASLVSNSKRDLEEAELRLRVQHQQNGTQGEPLDNTQRDLTVEPDLSDKEKRELNMGRYFKYRMFVDRSGNGQLVKAEEVQREIELVAETTKRAKEVDKIIGRAPKGEIIPRSALYNRSTQMVMGMKPEARQLGVTLGGATGDQIVPEDYRGDMFIDRLRNMLVTNAMGATSLNGLRGDLDIPRLLTSASAEWTGEIGEDTETLMTFGRLAFRPHHLRARQSWTRQLEMQSDPMVESLVMMDLERQMATALDFAGLHGDSGIDPDQPDGIANYSGVGTFSIDAVPSWANWVNFETLVNTGNALIGNNLGYVTTPGIKGVAKTTPKEAGQAIYSWTDQETINGYRAMSSNQVLSNLGAGLDEHGIFFGNWADLWYGFWGGLDFLVDPYTGASTSTTKVYFWLTADIQLKHAESFVYVPDARIS